MELRNFINDKKGSEMTIGTLVIIILAVIVLVVLAIGFTTGWENLWGTFIGFTGGQENVDDTIRDCRVACTQGKVYEYCNMDRELVYEDDEGELQSEDVTCQGLEEEENYDLTDDVKNITKEVECPAFDCD